MERIFSPFTQTIVRPLIFVRMSILTYRESWLWVVYNYLLNQGLIILPLANITNPQTMPPQYE